jgi:hypothetical protein
MRKKPTITVGEYMDMISSLSEIGKKEANEAYELEMEFNDMTFRLDIKDLDKFMLKMQTISKVLEGGS